MRRSLTLLTTTLVLALATAAAAQAQEGANPLFTGPPGGQGSSDPGVTFLDGQFRVTSSRGDRVRTSADLLDWREDQRLLADPPDWAVGGKIGSSQIYLLPASGGPYVLIFGAVHRRLGKYCVGRALSATPDNFRDQGAPLACGPRRGGKSLYSLKDPSLFLDQKNQLHLLHKRELQNHRIRSRRRPSDIVIRPIGLDAAKGGLGRRPVRLVVAEGEEGKSVEAPTMVFHNGRYFLFYSPGDYTTDRYGVSVAVSRPEANFPMAGAFKKNPGNPIYSGRSSDAFCGVGHQDVVPPIRPGGIWRLFAHAFLRSEQDGSGPFARCVDASARGAKPKRQLVLNTLFWDVKTSNPNFFWPRAGVDGAPTGDGATPRGNLTPAG